MCEDRPRVIESPSTLSPAGFPDVEPGPTEDL